VCLAAELGQLEVLAALIDAGAKPDLPVAKGWRPAHFAAQAGMACTLAVCILVIKLNLLGIFDRFKRVSQLCAALHAPCTMIYLVGMCVAC